MPHLVCLTLGSRGDLQPLVALAVQYKKQHKEHDITLVAAKHLEHIFQKLCTKYAIRYYSITQSNNRMEEMKQVWKACRYLEPDRLLYTTFVLEGYSIAEKLNIPSFVISLFPLDLYPIPNEFETQMQLEYPKLYKNSIKPLWPHVQHWMWRLFLEDQGDFREFVLDLDPIPVIHMPPQLMYALDPCIFSDYPKDICKAVGFWPLRSFENNSNLALNLSSEPVLLIHFGSMDTLSMTLIQPETFIQQIKVRIDEILSTFKALHIVWMSNPETALYKQLLQRNHDRIHIIPPSEHNYFTREYNVIGVIHHGGINTCCSMIQYGLHQAILPFMFDQKYWAERLQKLGVSKALQLESPWLDTVAWMFNKTVQSLIQSTQEKLAYNSKVGLQYVIDAIELKLK